MKRISRNTSNFLEFFPTAVPHSKLRLRNKKKPYNPIKHSVSLKSNVVFTYKFCPSTGTKLSS